MPSYYYRIRVESGHPLGGHHEVSEPGGSTVTWTHDTATDWARLKGPKNAAAGDRIVIERAKKGTVGRSGLTHPWLSHRAYIVGAGVVRAFTMRNLALTIAETLERLADDLARDAEPNQATATLAYAAVHMLKDLRPMLGGSIRRYDAADQSAILRASTQHTPDKLRAWAGAWREFAAGAP